MIRVIKIGEIKIRGRKIRTLAAGLTLVLAFALVGAGCATSPMGRKQLMLVPDAQMSAMGVQAFDQMKSQSQIDRDPAINNYVKCIVGPITRTAAPDVDAKNWEVVVFKDPQVNAFALPGGKIGVYTGILPVTKTDAQLAAVLGHEVGHVIAKHGAERVSQSIPLELGMVAGDALLKNKGYHDIGMAALGLGTQFGLAMPWSRTQEKEADDIGLDLMARAGFDPAQAVELWKNMTAAAGSGPPQILSDHPSNANRIRDLQARLPEAEAKYRQSQHVSCPRPPGI